MGVNCTFHDPVTPIMYGISRLHDHILFFLAIILFVVIYIFVTTITEFFYIKNLTNEEDNIFNYDIDNWKFTFNNNFIVKSALSFLYSDINNNDRPYVREMLTKYETWNVEFWNSLKKKQISINAGIDKFVFLKKHYEETLAVIKPSYPFKQQNLINLRIQDGKDFSSYVNYAFSWQWARLNNGVLVEIIWTIIPSIILLLIAIPSFALLFAIDEITLGKVLVKVIGHQWYWSYEISGIANVPFSVASFDSYMLSDSDLIKGDLRLLKTDNALILPKGMPILALITSDDVLHSWAIPSFGVKVDAIPGRLSQISLMLKTSGIFNGQCSELCGVNHGFMPIEVWVVDMHTYLRLEWFLKKYISL